MRSRISRRQRLRRDNRQKKRQCGIGLDIKGTHAKRIRRTNPANRQRVRACPPKERPARRVHPNRAERRQRDCSCGSRSTSFSEGNTSAVGDKIPILVVEAHEDKREGLCRPKRRVHTTSPPPHAPPTASPLL